jgi:hypothetical protein
MEIIIEHVRSFSIKQTVPLRPLTLLVGENSSGKSTFLAVVSAILDALRFPGNPGFNQAPYNLGTFDTIATHKGGRYGRDDTFTIGFSDDRPQRQVLATYRSDYGNVVLRQFQLQTPAASLVLDVSGSHLAARVALEQPNGHSARVLEFNQDLDEPPLAGRHPVALDFRYLLHAAMRSRRKGSEITEGEQGQLIRLFRAADPPFRSSFSFAPIRSKPRRTYDEFSEEYSPEGDHIPTLLARLLREEADSADSKRVQQALVRFGKESGLFKRIEVKRLGKKVSDPFQVQVVIAGPTVNLADVGYGVSQALPIIVQSVLRTTSPVFLLQQPEVHLHPRAQAALGSFFAEMVADSDRMFLIETHSDFLLDRVRQEVAAGNLNPDKVQILFFDRSHVSTGIRSITLDAKGNILDAPPGYRRFFLEEEVKLLARTGE